MPDRKTFFTNAWESSLATQMGDSDSQMTVSDAAALNVPCYLVIEAQNAGQREYVYVTAKNVNILTVTERYLAGSAAGSGLTHPNGATVTSIASAQAFTDLHDRVDVVSNAVPTHEAALDPHAQYVERAGDTMVGSLTLAGDPSGALEAATKSYVDTLVGDPAGTYLRLDGSNGPMTGFLTLSADPTADGHAATKAYVDGEIGAISTDHGDLTGLDGDDHPQYHTDARGDARYLPLSHESDVDAHHAKYTDSEAVSAMGSKSNSNPLNHDRVTLSSSHTSTSTTVAATPSLVNAKLRAHTGTNSEVIVSTSAPSGGQNGDIWLRV